MSTKTQQDKGVVEAFLKKHAMDVAKFEKEMETSEPRVIELQSTIAAAANAYRTRRELAELPMPQPPYLRPRFDQLAEDVLKRATIIIHDPIPDDQKFNEGETASIKIEVLNTTRLPLRDVILEVKTEGGIQVLSWPPHTRRFLGDMKPGDRKEITYILRGLEEGDWTVEAFLSAEVVPYVQAQPEDATRTIVVHPHT